MNKLDMIRVFCEQVRGKVFLSVLLLSVSLSVTIANPRYQLQQGMSVEEVKLKWGEPLEVVDRQLKDEVEWTYSERRYVIFKDRKVVSWSGQQEKTLKYDILPDGLATDDLAIDKDIDIKKNRQEGRSLAVGESVAGQKAKTREAKQAKAFLQELSKTGSADSGATKGNRRQIRSGEASIVAPQAIPIVSDEVDEGNDEEF